MNTIEISIAFLPILVFLGLMKFMDSFQLVRVRQVLTAIFAGFASAILASVLNLYLLGWLDISQISYSRLAAPVIEEFLKFLFIIWLIKASKMGFLVDAAILGFAVGAGFAIVENIYYMTLLGEAGMLTWTVRGFGTAIMHGGTTAVAAVISKDIADRKKWSSVLIFLPGLISAIILHALFNMFILPPVTSALIIILMLPPVFYFIFKHSENNTRRWLGTGLDSDMELLQLLLAGNISETKIGHYLQSIQKKFTPAVVGDIICYLRTYLELSIKAKGILILKESGLDLPPDPEVEAQFAELEYIEKQIGKTGKLALRPLLKLNNTDVWQLSMIRQNNYKYYFLNFSRFYSNKSD